MGELQNIFTKGTQALQIDDSLLYVPINEDYVFLAEVLSYNETDGKITAKKVWDTSESPKSFFVRAFYYGQAGTPTASEVVAGLKIAVYRVGCSNNNFSSLSEVLQLRDTTNTTGISFASFFFP